MKKVVRFFFKSFIGIYEELHADAVKLSFKEAVADFLAVFRGVGMLIFLNLLATVVFLFLPQGKDVIYIVSEDLASRPIQFGNFIWLIAGVFFWSLVSEFASRYALYVTDNSGKGLSGERVAWRKALQKALSTLFL